jgi:cysteine desulfurase/selenocysteine lyase
MDDNGELILDDLDKYLATGKVKLVTFSLMSNVLGTITDAEKIISKCKEHGVLTLVDGAQAVPHMPVDVEKLGCDFFAFSGHKMLGPTGIGVLWVRKSVLETMNPFHGCGDMIREVHKYETTWNDLPYKFEAGTPNIADVIGLGSAIDYLTKIGMTNVREHEIELTSYAIEKLSQVKGLTIYGTKDISKRGGVISFNFSDVHPHDVAQIIDEEGIAVRSGHHCAQVLMERLNVAATSRASFYIYNTKEEVDSLIAALTKVARIFKL